MQSTQEKISPLPKKQIIDCWVSVGSYQSILGQIIQLAKSKISSYVCFANVHMLSEAHHNPDFRKVVNQADLVSADGKPLSVLMRYQYNIDQERVCGMDLFPDILNQAANQGLKIFFFGSTDDLLQLVTDKAQQEFSKLKIAGAYAPPFRPLSKEEDEEIVRMINLSDADLVFVSLGCPKQEKWMHDHKGKVDACMLGLGQAFRTYAGVEKRLPRWARDYALEWLYRFFLEPKRLWKRYLLGNSWFLWEATKSLLRHKLAK